MLKIVDCNENITNITTRTLLKYLHIYVITLSKL